MMNRRTLGRGIATIALGGSPLVQAQPAPTPVRKSIASTTVELPDLSDYRRAVRLMKELPSSDPRNWARQAEIHRDHCPHSNWWFLPWHRAYLHYFEQVCRNVLQKPSFALPYWDWTSFPAFPGAFRDRNSSLYHDGRSNAGNPILNETLVGRPVMDRILRSNSQITMYSAPTSSNDQREGANSGQLEGSPHNHVHSAIRGDMGTFMSPLDPIFWLHHCNIDRIWESWLGIHQRAFPAAPLWKNHLLTSFYDVRTNSTKNPTAESTINSAAWGAKYDRAERLTQGLISMARPPRSVSAADDAVFRFGLVKALSTSSPVRSSIRLTEATKVELNSGPELGALVESAARLAALGNSPTLPDLLLQIEGVPQPQSPTVAVRVFLNCNSPSLNTPLDDPSYVGTLAFFAEHHPRPQGSNFVFDVRDTLARLRATGAYTAGTPIEVALLPYDTADPSITLGSIQARQVRLLGL